MIAVSSWQTSLLRYWRSWGLWLLLLVAPVGARYMLPIDGQGVVIAIGGQLPVMTSQFLGVSLGIVVSTLVLPIAWLYLRSNTTRRHPWQVEEVTAGSRVAIALGRFGADVVIMLAMLATLTLAGLFLGWLLIPPRPFNVFEIALPLWLVAAPALMGTAGLRIFLMRGHCCAAALATFSISCCGSPRSSCRRSRRGKRARSPQTWSISPAS